MSSQLEIASNDKVWYITGASKGLGLVFVKKLLGYGFKVVATSRNKEQLIAAVGDLAKSDNFLAIKVDLDNEESVKSSLTETLSKFSRIDVIVNNAGYATTGAVEESSASEVLKNFEINVFGVLNVLRNAAPILRRQGFGFVVNISSIGSTYGFQGHSTYCATKAAVDILTESYDTEMKPFGVRAVAINPGYFKTDFLTSDSYQKPGNRIDAYKAVHEMDANLRDNVNHNQRGDAGKLVDVVIRIYQDKESQVTRVYIGADAVPLAKAKLEALKKDIEYWEKYSAATDRDDYVDPAAVSTNSVQ